MGKEEFIQSVEEKLKQIWLAMEDLWAQFLRWTDKVLPPEKRPGVMHHWLHVALVLLIVLVAAYMLYRCCKCCCCCGGSGRRGRYRTMKAPGRNARMWRDAFEADPRGYFQNLRSHPGDELC